MENEEDLPDFDSTYCWVERRLIEEQSLEDSCSCENIVEIDAVEWVEDDEHLTNDESHDVVETEYQSSNQRVDVA